MPPTKKSLDVIRLRNAVFYAYHGVLSGEQSHGGKFEVDVDLFCDLSKASRSDSLPQTVDYERVYDTIRSLVTQKKHFLLESVAGVIADGLLKNFKKVQGVVVRVRKPHPPIKGVIDYVEVEHSKWRT